LGIRNLSALDFRRLDKVICPAFYFDRREASRMLETGKI
jgi:hypothetical protein